jgi:hypothetical protein
MDTYQGKKEFFDSGPGGTFYLCVVKDPEAWEEGETLDGGYLESDLYGDEWANLFFDVLGCPRPVDIEGNTREEKLEKYKLAFQSAIPDCPLLGRIWNFYSESIFINYEEVMNLKNECEMVKHRTTASKASQGLDKLIEACNVALKEEMGLLLDID